MLCILTYLCVAIVKLTTILFLVAHVKTISLQKCTDQKDIKWDAFQKINRFGYGNSANGMVKKI